MEQKRWTAEIKECSHVRGAKQLLWREEAVLWRVCKPNCGRNCVQKIPGGKTPKTLAHCCNLLHLSERKYLPTNLFKIFQSRLTQGAHFLVCVWRSRLWCLQQQEEKTTESCKPGRWDTARTSLKQLLSSQKPYKDLGSRVCSPQREWRIDSWAATGGPSAETFCAGGRFLISFFLFLVPGHSSFPQFTRLITLVCYNSDFCCCSSAFSREFIPLEAWYGSTWEL